MSSVQRVLLLPTFISVNFGLFSHLVEFSLNFELFFELFVELLLEHFRVQIHFFRRFPLLFVSVFFILFVLFWGLVFKMYIFKF